MLWFAGCVIAAALLWLGPEIGLAARSRPPRLAWGLKACAVALTTCGLWWPGHLAAGAEPPTANAGLMAVVSWTVALALAMLTTVIAAAAAKRTVAAFLALSVVAVLLAYGHAMLAMPALFRAALVVGPWAPGASAALITAGLIGVQVEGRPQRRPRVRRAMIALVLGGLLALAVALAPGIPEPLAPTWAQTLLMVGLVLMGATMLATLWSASSSEHETARRTAAPPAPTVDSLTQLPTRLYFEDRLAAAAMKADARTSRLALLFIDLDGFKPVNDTYGHSVGDKVLAQVGQRLKALSRGKDVVARVGGDEFLLLLTNVVTEESVAHVAARLINGLSQAYTVDGREVIISCSVGIALYPDGCSHAKLIARADAAMYAAKRSGGSTHCFYSPAMDADAERQFDLLRDLRKALANKEMELQYQPKIDVKSGKVTATEALLRWKHPTRGIILPSVFIPIAERFGLIVAIGNWVIEDACRQSRAWRDKGLRMRVAINLSAHQMRQDDIVERITEALTRYRIHPSLLTCEITETAAMEDTKATQETFRRLGELGTHLSIDDFGTGYSSLSYLRKLPAEELKIDRSFIMDLEHSADARAVVDAVIKLAHALGLKVVAEGVENQRQQQILVDMQCDELQGFLFAKPMSARALQLWAINDRTQSAVFKPSLFDESRQSPVAGAA
ncbi:MAG TPA: bifunctional diguanylate cyclase/phosphodiesterase [Caldimonas sp.]|nr:bifunctional diguanylate cyclase/phosphodiesterase [Caldimonas sp.]